MKIEDCLDTLNLINFSIDTDGEPLKITRSPMQPDEIYINGMKKPLDKNLDLEISDINIRYSLFHGLVITFNTKEKPQ